MGQVLYRKYRSKSLAEVYGQDHITKTLELSLKKGSISHAYLLTGPRGTGKTSVGRILAYAINGVDYDESKFYADIIEIDAASNGRVDEIRDLRESVRIMPNELKYKVYIIDEVHMLSSGAFNALLKTLEEPPAHVVFILATTELHKIPKTIVSRTQRYNFRFIPEDIITEHLNRIVKTEKIKIDKESLSLVAKGAAGSFRDALSLLDKLAQTGLEINQEFTREALGMAQDEVLQELINSYRSLDIQATLITLRALIDSGVDPVNISKQLIYRLRDGLNNSPSLKDDVGLMKQLLLVQTSRDPESALEISLLKLPESPLTTAVMHKPTQPKPSTPKTLKPTPKMSPVVEPKEITNLKEVAKAKVNKEITDTPKQNSGREMTLEDWPLILAKVQETRNSIYIVLKMADITVDDGHIVATFKFAFHVKQINDTQNLSYLKEVINDSGYDIKSIKISQSSEGKPKSKDDEDITPEEIFTAGAAMHTHNSGPPTPDMSPAPSPPPDLVELIPDNILSVFGDAEVVG